MNEISHNNLTSVSKLQLQCYMVSCMHSVKCACFVFRIKVAVKYHDGPHCQKHLKFTLHLIFKQYFIHVHSEPFIGNSIFMVYRIRCMTPDLVPVIKDMNIWNKANLVSVGLQCWQKNDFLRNYCFSVPPCILQVLYHSFQSLTLERLCQFSICLTFKMALKAFIIPQL